MVSLQNREIIGGCTFEQSRKMIEKYGNENSDYSLLKK
jgi:hypothetical protein